MCEGMDATVRFLWSFLPPGLPRPLKLLGAVVACLPGFLPPWAAQLCISCLAAFPPAASCAATPRLPCNPWPCLQPLNSINTRAPGTQRAAGAAGGVGSGSMPATPMSATSDVFDGLMTPAAAASAAQAGVAAQAFGRPQGVPPLAMGSAVASMAMCPPGSVAPSARGEDLSGRQSDVFDFLQTPAHGSGAAEAAAAALAAAADAGSAAGGWPAGADASMPDVPGVEEAASSMGAGAASPAPLGITAGQEGEEGAVPSAAAAAEAPAAGAAAERRAGFHFDISQLAEGSETGGWVGWPGPFLQLPSQPLRSSVGVLLFILRRKCWLYLAGILWGLAAVQEVGVHFAAIACSSRGAVVAAACTLVSSSPSAALPPFPALHDVFQ